MKKIEHLVEEYLQRINSKKEACITNEKELKASECKDEANLEKVKINIYNIFISLLKATEKQVSSQKDIPQEKQYEIFCVKYLEKINQIPSNWRDSLENAKKNDDIITTVIEENKLRVADELKNIFLNLV